MPQEIPRFVRTLVVVQIDLAGQDSCTGSYFAGVRRALFPEDIIQSEREGEIQLNKFFVMPKEIIFKDTDAEAQPSIRTPGLPRSLKRLSKLAEDTTPGPKYSR